MILQTDIFGGARPAGRRLLPSELPTPINDWALALYIIMNHPKGVTVFDAMKMYGMVKFQERLNEVVREYDEVVDKKIVTVAKRLGRRVQVMRYKLADIDKAMDIYATLNKKGGSKSLKLNISHDNA